MKTALVLCGGSAHGAIEVGLYKALEELKITFDFIVGTSIGAINGAMIAAGVSATELEKAWQKIRTEHVLDFRLWWFRILTRQQAISTGHRLENFLKKTLPVQNFDELKKKLYIISTDLISNEMIILEKGNLINALMASTALPGLLPPRKMDGRVLVDGAVTANMPVLVAQQMGAEQIITFPCRCLGDWKKTPVTMINILLKSITILIKTQETCHLQLLEDSIQSLVVEACPGKRLGTLDFDNAHRLIEPAYQRAKQLLLAEAIH